MTAHQAVRVARPRGEVDRRTVDAIQAQQQSVERAQQQLERLVSEALDAGTPLNELARQTGIAKTTLIRWAKK
jgi:DNA invertase Pin-like site-specific DNA recombinase